MTYKVKPGRICALVSGQLNPLKELTLMQFSSSLSRRITRTLPIITTSILLSGLFSSYAFSATPDVPETSKSKSATSTKVSPEEIHRQEAWRDFMRVTPKPKSGCFTATYPKSEWQEVTCVSPPPYPMPPRRGVRPLVVGNGDDISAQVSTASFISTAIGSFDSVPASPARAHRLLTRVHP